MPSGLSISLYATIIINLGAILISENKGLFSYFRILYADALSI